MPPLIQLTRAIHLSVYPERRSYRINGGWPARRRVAPSIRQAAARREPKGIYRPPALRLQRLQRGARATLDDRALVLGQLRRRFGTSVAEELAKEVPTGEGVALRAVVEESGLAPDGRRRSQLATSVAALVQLSADNWLTIGSGWGWVRVGTGGRKPCDLQLVAVGFE
jgi:hypothetical protein